MIFNCSGTRVLYEPLVLLFEQIVQVVFGKFGGAGLSGERGGVFPEAASFDEHLGLQDLVVFTGFALHVINGVSEFHVRVKPENHIAPGTESAASACRRLFWPLHTFGCSLRRVRILTEVGVA